MKNIENCEDYKDYICLALDDEISPQKAKNLDNHLKQCISCQNYYKKCKAVDERCEKIFFQTQPRSLSKNLDKLTLSDKVNQLVLKKHYLLEITNILRRQLPAAAGTADKLTTISEQLLSEGGIPRDTSIVFDLKPSGYSIRVESNNPINLILIFFKNDQELFKTKISELIPMELVPPKAIEGWTNIKILRENKDAL